MMNWCTPAVPSKNEPVAVAATRYACSATFAGVGGDATPLDVSKRSVVELRGEDQQIDLADYSRLVILFLVLGQYSTQLWQVKGQIFANSMIFFCFTSPYLQKYWSYRHDIFTSVFPVQSCMECGVLMHLGWIFRVYSARGGPRKYPRKGLLETRRSSIISPVGGLILPPPRGPLKILPF